MRSLLCMCCCLKTRASVSAANLKVYKDTNHIQWCESVILSSRLKMLKEMNTAEFGICFCGPPSVPEEITWNMPFLKVFVYYRFWELLFGTVVAWFSFGVPYALRWLECLVLATLLSRFPLNPFSVVLRGQGKSRDWPLWVLSVFDHLTLYSVYLLACVGEGIYC